MSHISTAARLLCSLALLTGLARGQVEHGGLPPSFRLRAKRALPTERMAPVRSDLLLAEDAAQQAAGKAPLRFAEVLPVELGLANAGVWEALPGGARSWRLRIHSPGAKSLALVFSRFRLASGAELYVYDDRHAEVRGAYTDLENRLDGEFAMRPLRGDALTLELYEPAAEVGRSELVLGLVAHDYRDVYALMDPDPDDRSGGGGQGASCELDVACPLGDGWDDQKNAVVHIMALAAGTFCSGSLLNNTSGDGTLLVLSAGHCNFLANSVYTFNFERPACRDGVAPCTNTITGATVLVRDEGVDVQLARLDAPQGPLPWPVYLAGWDRSDVPPASSFLIHHPAGAPKKFSRDDDPPRIFENFWRILGWERGISEGGSSGAPLFDPAGRFIGNLDSGTSTCQVPSAHDFCTRLAAAWPLLEPYLDPLGTGATVLDGLDLARVTPQAFDVTGVFPPQVEPLDPGPRRSLRILGSGFTDATSVRLDGVALDAARYLRGGHDFIDVDLAPLAVGPHNFDVTEGSQVKRVPFEVVPAREPRMQTANGVPGELVFSSQGVDTYHSDVPGHVHLCIWSLSSAPSVNSYLSLGLGNQFTDLRPCQLNPIPFDGFLRIHHTIPLGKLPFGTRVYNQSVCLQHGIPFHTTNLEETVFQF